MARKAKPPRRSYQRTTGAITPIEYSGLQQAYDHFNAELFDGTLPDVFITNQTDEQVRQTLTHEMVHVWQHAHGKPSARGYHNTEWTAKMKSIGLQPSSTGMVGGKETGQRMMDYIIPDGPFTKSYAKLAARGWALNLQSAHRPGPKGGVNSKTKFTCSSCGQNAWGKPDLAILCKPCKIQMREPKLAA